MRIFVEVTLLLIIARIMLQGLLASLVPGPQLEPPLSETGRDETTCT